MSSQAEKLIDFRGRSVSFCWDTHLGHTLMGKENSQETPKCSLHSESVPRGRSGFHHLLSWGYRCRVTGSTLAFPEVKRRMTVVLSGLSFVLLKGFWDGYRRKKMPGGWASPGGSGRRQIKLPQAKRGDACRHCQPRQAALKASRNVSLFEPWLSASSQ